MYAKTMWRLPRQRNRNRSYSWGGGTGWELAGGGDLRTDGQMDVLWALAGVKVSVPSWGRCPKLSKTLKFTFKRQCQKIFVFFIKNLVSHIILGRVVYFYPNQSRNNIVMKKKSTKTLKNFKKIRITVPNILPVVSSKSGSWFDSG